MVTILPLSSKEQTGEELRRMIETYHRDLDNAYIVRRLGKPEVASQSSFINFFNSVSSIPFKKDLYQYEVAARPLSILSDFPRGIDCKKKSILMGSWARCNGVQYKLIASSTRPDRAIHHVFPMFMLDGKWVPVDATYPGSIPFTKRRHTAEVEI